MSAAHVYTHQELAALVAEHDQEYPDHRGDCTCHNGVIPTLRAYFSAVKQPVSDAIRPYVPPGLCEPRPRLTRRPWQHQRDGETKTQYDWRISHSCYNCGTVIADDALLNEHEDNCSAQGRRS